MRKVTVFIISFLIIFCQGIAHAQADTYYVVQVGYYRNKAIMEMDFGILVEKGIPVYKTVFNGGHRLYVGDYTTKEDAEKMAQKVNEIGFETLVRTKQRNLPKPKQTYVKEVKEVMKQEEVKDETSISMEEELPVSMEEILLEEDKTSEDLDKTKDPFIEISEPLYVEEDDEGEHYSAKAEQEVKS